MCKNKIMKMGEGEIRKNNKGHEFYQSTLYVYMETSQETSL
jgi:hypothetical protein